MKKVMFLVMVAVMPFVACNSDDEGQDPIIGEWKYTAEATFINGKKQPPEVLSDCEKKTNIVFTRDGRGLANFYDYGTNGACANKGIAPVRWVNKGKSIYELFYSLDGDGTTKPYEVVFKGNTMEITETLEVGQDLYVEVETYVKAK